jgi:hypothetical protein
MAPSHLQHDHQPMSLSGLSRQKHSEQPYQSFSSLTTPLTGYGHPFEVPGSAGGVGSGYGYGYGYNQLETPNMEYIPAERKGGAGDEEMRDDQEKRGEGKGEEKRLEEELQESASSSQLTSLSSENDTYQPVQQKSNEPRSRSTSGKMRPPLPPQTNSVRSPPRTRAYAASLAERASRSRSSTASKKEVRVQSIAIPSLPKPSSKSTIPPRSLRPPQPPTLPTRKAMDPSLSIPTIFSPTKLVISPEGTTPQSSASFRYFGLTPQEYSAAARRDQEERGTMEQGESEEEELSEESMEEEKIEDGDIGSDKGNIKDIKDGEDGEDGEDAEELENTGGDMSMSSENSRVTVESVVINESKPEVKVRVSLVGSGKERYVQFHIPVSDLKSSLSSPL